MKHFTSDPIHITHEGRSVATLHGPIAVEYPASSEPRRSRLPRSVTLRFDVLPTIRHGVNGWELVAYDREWMPDVALLTYEHPQHGLREVLHALRSGRIVP